MHLTNLPFARYFSSKPNTIPLTEDNKGISEILLLPIGIPIVT